VDEGRRRKGVKGEGKLRLGRRYVGNGGREVEGTDSEAMAKV
jgi:hypothetical protein